MISIDEASHSLTLTVCAIVELIQGDKLTRVGVGSSSNGIMSLKVDPNEVRGAVTAGALEIEEDTTNVYNVEQIAERLNTSREAIGALIDLGGIAVHIRRQPRINSPYRVATIQTVREFEKRYVSLSECCRRTGLHHAVVRKIFRTAGVESVAAFASMRELFYFREEAEAALRFRIENGTPWAPIVA